MLIEYLYSPFHHTCWFFFCATLFFQRLALTGETHLDGIAWLYGFDKTQAFQPVVSNDRTDTGIDKQTRSRRKHKIPMHHPPTENRFGSSNLIHMCIEMIAAEASKVNNIGLCHCAAGSQQAVAWLQLLKIFAERMNTIFFDFRTAHSLFTDSGKHRRTTLNSGSLHVMFHRS